MKKIYCMGIINHIAKVLVIVVVCFAFCNISYATDYRSIKSTNWTSSDAWQYYNGSEWVDASTYPNSASDRVEIQHNHTINVNGEFTVLKLQTDGGGKLSFSSGNAKITVGAEGVWNNGEINFYSDNNTLIVNGQYDNYSSTTIYNSNNTIRVSGKFINGYNEGWGSGEWTHIDVNGNNTTIEAGQWENRQWFTLRGGSNTKITIKGDLDNYHTIFFDDNGGSVFYVEGDLNNKVSSSNVQAHRNDYALRFGGETYKNGENCPIKLIVKGNLTTESHANIGMLTSGNEVYVGFKLEGGQIVEGSEKGIIKNSETEIYIGRLVGHDNRWTEIKANVYKNLIKARSIENTGAIHFYSGSSSIENTNTIETIGELYNSGTIYVKGEKNNGDGYNTLKMGSLLNDGSINISSTNNTVKVARGAVNNYNIDVAGNSSKSGYNQVEFNTLTNNGTIISNANNNTFVSNGDVVTNGQISLNSSYGYNVWKSYGEMYIAQGGEFHTGNGESSKDSQLQIYGDLKVYDSDSFKPKDYNVENNNRGWVRFMGSSGSVHKLNGDNHQPYIRRMYVDADNTVVVGADNNRTTLDNQWIKFDDCIENHGNLVIWGTWYCGAMRNYGKVECKADAHFLNYGICTNYADGNIEVDDCYIIKNTKADFTNNGTIKSLNDVKFQSDNVYLVGEGRLEVTKDLTVLSDKQLFDYANVSTTTRKNTIAFIGTENSNITSSADLYFQGFELAKVSKDYVISSPVGLYSYGTFAADGGVLVFSNGKMFQYRGPNASGITGNPQKGWVNGLFRIMSKETSKYIFPVGSDTEGAYATFTPSVSGKNYTMRYYGTKCSKAGTSAKTYQAMEDRYWYLSPLGTFSDFGLLYDVFLFDDSKTEGRFLSTYYCYASQNKWNEIQSLTDDETSLSGHHFVTADNTSVGIVSNTVYLSFSVRSDKQNLIPADGHDGDYTWTGAANNTKWETANNWLNLKVPSDATHDVFLKDEYNLGTLKDGGYEYPIVRKVLKQVSVNGVSVANYPTIASGKTGKCGNIEIESVASLIVDGTLESYGNIQTDIDEIGGSGTIKLLGSTAKDVKRLDSTEPMDLFIKPAVEVNNSNGVTIESGVNLTLTSTLTLTDGVVTVAGDDNYIKMTKGGVDDVVGGSADSYIDGYLFRTCSNSGKDIVYPVGDNGRYAKAEIRHKESGKSIGVRYTNAFPTTYSDGSNLYYTLSDEYWEVKPFTTTDQTEIRSKFYFDEKSNIWSYRPSGTTIAYTKFTPVEWKPMSTSKITLDADNHFLFYNDNIQIDPNGWVMSFGYQGVNLKRWTGSVDNNWFDVANWSAGILPTNSDAIFVGECASNRYPIINKKDAVAVAKDLVISGDNAKITLDGGSLNITGALTVADNANAGHVIINQKYSQSSNLMYGSTNYEKFTVDRTFKNGPFYYVGSATEEGKIETMTNEEQFYSWMYYYPKEQYYYLGDWSTGVKDTYTLNKWGGLDYTNYSNLSLGKEIAWQNTGTNTGAENSFTQIGKLPKTDGTAPIIQETPIASGEWYGWHLLSNPYQLALDMSKFTYIQNDQYENLAAADQKGVFFNHVEPAIWFFNTQGGQEFETYSLASGVGVSQSWDKFNKQDKTYIAPNQAFFVRSTSVNSPRVVFNMTADKWSSMVVTAGTSLKTLRAESDVLRLVVSDDGEKGDEMAFVFRQGGTLDANELDATKRMSGNDVAHVYAIKQGGSRCSIPLMPETSEIGSEMMPIGVRLPSGATEGVILATNIDEFDQMMDVILYDMQLGTEVSMREVDGEYHFEAEGGVHIADRFAIGVKSIMGSGEVENNVPTGVSSERIGIIQISQNPSRDAIIRIGSDMIATGAVVNVYDMTGKLIKKQTLDKVETTVTLGEPKGLYIVEAVTNAGSESKKLMK